MPVPAFQGISSGLWEARGVWRGKLELALVAAEAGRDTMDGQSDRSMPSCARRRMHEDEQTSYQRIVCQLVETTGPAWGPFSLPHFPLAAVSARLPSAQPWKPSSVEIEALHTLDGRTSMRGPQHLHYCGTPFHHHPGLLLVRQAACHPRLCVLMFLCT